MNNEDIKKLEKENKELAKIYKDLAKRYKNKAEVAEICSLSSQYDKQEKAFFKQHSIGSAGLAKCYELIAKGCEDKNKELIDKGTKLIDNYKRYL